MALFLNPSLSQNLSEFIRVHPWLICIFSVAIIGSSIWIFPWLPSVAQLASSLRSSSWAILLGTVLFQAGCDAKPTSVPELVWGVHGTQPGWLHKPRVAAFDAQDELYIADLTDRIQVFDRDGQYLRGWRTPDFNVDGPSGLSVDRHGRLLVADTHFYRVLVYSRSGELLLQLGDGVQGTTPGRFGYPTDVVLDRADNFYVA